MTNEEVIVAQAKKLLVLEEEVARLKDDETKSKEWTAERKRQAGFPDNVSLDVVWERMLKVFKRDLPRVMGREPTDKEVDSACLSMDHSFGLVTDEDRRKKFRLEAREWQHVWRKVDEDERRKDLG